jgi:enamine deaminase RidA (YjgF/YER057c/UK114 family)
LRYSLSADIFHSTSVLAQRIGGEVGTSCSQQLSHIERWCIMNVKPLITALTVGGLTIGVSFAAAAVTDPTGPEARIKARNITLPVPPVRIANYVDAVQVGNLLFVSGNTSRDFEPKGKLGRELTTEQGYQAARYTGLLFLAKLKAHLGTLDRIKRIVKVLGLVNSADGFGDQPKVMNGFSDLMVEVFGEAAGMHARSAIGVAGLPGNAPVEVEAVLEVE